MVEGQNRLAQLFLWKEGAAPDLSYARQVLSVVNPEAYKAVLGDNPPLQLFSVIGSWPDDLWAKALQDISSLRAADGSQWSDTARYDLAGWQGKDQRSGDRLFLVTAYRRASPVPAGTFTGSGVGAPPAQPQVPTPQVPYYPQFPTGPLAWPPNSQSQAQGQQPQSPYSYPPAYLQLPQPTAYQYGYNPMVTGALPTIPGPDLSQQAAGATVPPLTVQPQLTHVTGALPIMQGPPSGFDGTPFGLPDSYAPFYASFGTRFSAGLIDLFFLGLLQATAIAAFLYLGPQLPSMASGDWLGAYGPFAGIALFVTVLYFVPQWSIGGQTLGKRLMRIRVVTADGSSPKLGRSLLRMFGYLFSLSIVGSGFLLVALDPRRQGLHDKMAETYVIPEQLTQPAPTYLPGYRRPAHDLYAGGQPQPVVQPQAQPVPAGLHPAQQATVGLAAVGTQLPYGVGQIASTPEGVAGRRHAVAPQPGSPSQLAESDPTPPSRAIVRRGLDTLPDMLDPVEGVNTLPSLPDIPTGPVTEILLSQGERASDEQNSKQAGARELFRSGLAEMERGLRTGLSGNGVEPSAARSAAFEFRGALEFVPNSVAYRYYYAVALRYAEGFEAALGEFRQVLERDPSHFEARQQVAYGPRWHDAFYYPTWSTPAPVEVGQPLTDRVRSLLPAGRDPGTRLAILRDGASKVVAPLSRTPRKSWSTMPTSEMTTRINLVVSRTPQGPIIAIYIIVEDDPLDPYIGETFLNPHDPGQPSDDACQLGQHMLEQIARQDRTFLVFVDENNNLLLSRKFTFDASTQVTIARVLYEVQSLPPQVMSPDRFRQAAQWHMEHFSLDQLKPSN